jgi:hypothetical protein
MNIYLAAGFGRRLEIKALAARLRQSLDCCIVSRWLDCDSDDDGTKAPEAVTQADIWADICLEDVRKAQVLVCVAEPGRAFSRGGRHFETGFAYAIGKSIIVLGEREHVFHMLPGTLHVTDEAALILALKHWEGKVV